MNVSTRIFAIMVASTAILVVEAFQPLVTSAQTLQTKRIMQQKLTDSQQLLADVVTSNWAALDRHTRALDALTRQPGWDVMRLPEFHDQTTAFQKAMASLLDAAKQREQRTAVTAYNNLVSSCVECHRYVARARIAAAR